MPDTITSQPAVADAEGQTAPVSLETGATVAAEGTPKEPEKKEQKTVGQAWQDLRASASKLFATARYNAISAMPRFFVNNSSNILGAAHVGTEIMMFKASLKERKLVENPKNPVDYVVRAIKHVYTDAFEKSGSDVAEMKEAMKDNKVRGFVNYIRDTDGATKRAVEPQLALGKLGKLTDKGEPITRANVSLGNPWQTRSTLSGLIVWTLSALIPDKKESPDEVERMAVLRATNLPGYIGERIRQAVWFPDWGSHKRQMIGLGIMVSGICSMIGSWRNNVDTFKKVEGILEKCRVYEFNPSYFATAALTFVSSLPLLFASDDQKGFSGFGSWMTGRLAFLPTSIAKKFKGDKGPAMYYTAATLGFQAENWTQALIGGAEKLPDGTIVDHEEAKEKARAEVKEIKQARAAAKHRGSVLHDNVPGTQLTSIASAERAMPDRVEAMAQESAAVAG